MHIFIVCFIVTSVPQSNVVSVLKSLCSVVSAHFTPTFSLKLYLLRRINVKKSCEVLYRDDVPTIHHRGVYAGLRQCTDFPPLQAKHSRCKDV